MSDPVTIGQIVMTTITTVATGLGGYFVHRNNQRAHELKKEEQASNVLLAALKDERAQLSAERARLDAARQDAEQLRGAREKAEDETHDCESALREVRAKLSENEAQLAANAKEIASLQAHQRACEELQREFQAFKHDVLSGHTSGSPAE